MMFGLEWQSWLPLWMFSPVLAALAWTDFSRMRIPNIFSLAGIAIFLLSPLFLDMNDALLRLVAGSICFAICFALFAIGWLGGGDAKILPVVFLMIPPSVLSTYLFVLAAAMALGLVVMAIVRRTLHQPLSGYDSVVQKREFPLGIAIGSSGLLLAAVTFVGAVF